MKTDYLKVVEALDLPQSVRFAVWDKDSTLADTQQRQHLIAEVRAGRATWVDYSLACAEDTPIPGAVKLMRMLHDTYWNVVLSGANESARPQIEEWGKRHDIPWDAVILRADGDHAPNPVYKARMVKAMLDLGLHVELMVEDYPAAAAAVRELGIPVLVVNPCYPENELYKAGGAV